MREKLMLPAGYSVFYMEPAKASDPAMRMIYGDEPFYKVEVQTGVVHAAHLDIPVTKPVARIYARGGVFVVYDHGFAKLQDAVDSVISDEEAAR